MNGGLSVGEVGAQLDRLGPTVDIRMAYLFRRGEDALHMDELDNAAAVREGMELRTIVSGTDLTPLWAWLERRSAAERWPDLRRAVYSRPKPGAAGAPHSA